MVANLVLPFSNNQANGTVIYSAKVYIISPVLVAVVTERVDRCEYEGIKIVWWLKTEFLMQRAQTISVQLWVFTDVNYRKDW